jgi:pimeloyl-ACP methyl ester carboxylesterase
MDVLRTPDERFEGLPGHPFAPRWLDVEGLRIHHVDEGPGDAAPVLLLHGEPSWSYLYRKMIPVITAAGHRVVAPDLVGFGRIPGARGQPHTTIAGAGHFLQEDRGEELARVVVDFIART